MSTEEDRILDAVTRTQIVRLPKQNLATFGTTSIHYYMVTEPAYMDLEPEAVPETVVREGRVIAERPRIVTPYYLSRLEGFGPEARQYLNMLVQNYGANSPGLFYTYKNEPKGFNIVSDNPVSVVDKISSDLDKRGDPLVSIIRGEDHLWDVSLMKFIYEITRASVKHNVAQLSGRGLLDMDSGGVPLDARIRIDELFRQVYRGEREPRELKEELDRWGVFEEYQDKFFNLFRRGA